MVTVVVWKKRTKYRNFLKDEALYIIHIGRVKKKVNKVSTEKKIKPHLKLFRSYEKVINVVKKIIKFICNSKKPFV